MYEALNSWRNSMVSNEIGLVRCRQHTVCLTVLSLFVLVTSRITVDTIHFFFYFIFTISLSLIFSDICFVFLQDSSYSNNTLLDNISYFPLHSICRFENTENEFSFFHPSVYCFYNTFICCYAFTSWSYIRMLAFF